MNQQELKTIEHLRNIVFMEDIPSPTVPEYIEHHKSITKILGFIDKEILNRECYISFKNEFKEDK